MKELSCDYRENVRALGAELRVSENFDMVSRRLLIGEDELTYRDYMISEDLRNADITAWHEGIIANIPTTIKSTKRLQMDLVLGNM